MLAKLFNRTPIDEATEQARETWVGQVAPQALDVGDDLLAFPGALLLPLTVRGSGMPGMTERPWSRLRAGDFFGGMPLIYSLAIRRAAPDTLRASLRTRRTLFEGALLALSEKTGRRPSQAETLADQAMDTAESQLALGAPAFHITVLAALSARPEDEVMVESARRTLEAALRAKGFIPQRLFFIAERALEHLQPGGTFFPGFDEPVLMLGEAVQLLPAPSRRVMPVADSVRIGRHAGEGRDVYFSFQQGFVPDAPTPAHGIGLILGEMGSGKTSLMRLIYLQRLLQGRSIVTIDPEGENNRLCAAMGGTVIPAGTPEDPGTCLLHPLQASNPGEMLLAVRFLLSVVRTEADLTAAETAVLHEAVQKRWKRRPGQLALVQLMDAIATVPVEESRGLAASLKPWARGGLWDGFFDRERALIAPRIPSGAWMNFDLSKLREENKRVVHAAFSWFLYHAIALRPKAGSGDAPDAGLDIYIDEGWRLLKEGAFAQLLDDLSRRARKRGVGVMLTTHLPGDLAKGNTALGLASNAFLGRMGPEEAAAFFRSMGTNEAESRRMAGLVAQLPPRTFLAAPAGGRSGLFPVQVEIPPAWLTLWEKLGARN